MSTHHAAASAISRRAFARRLAAGAPALWLVRPGVAWPAPLPPTPAATNETFWTSVREQFLLPPGFTIMNAANLCPSSAPVLESMYRNTKDMDRNPSHENREKMGAGKETTRKILAEFLGATPGEIIVTRNTSEANNLVSSGVDLRTGDEIVIYSDNHPSNNIAWREKAKRFGFAVKVVQQVNPHPGAQHYLDAFAKEITPKTRLIAFTHMTSTVGDVFPAAELCRMARERGILSHVDGAQSFGLFDVNLSQMQPDFYSGSAHKWPCGPKECGVLFVNKNAHSKIWPTLYSAYPGAVGISKTHETFGQRDEPAIIAFGEALTFQSKIGRGVVERRSRELGQALIEGLKKLDGVKLWTSPDPERSGPVVSFLPGNLDLKRLTAALYEKDNIACTTRGGADRGGLRLSPHFYNLHEEVDRTLAAIKKYIATGV